MPLFRNRNENQDESPALEEIGAAWVPASVRERPVPATMPIEDDDGPDASSSSCRDSSARSKARPEAGGPGGNRLGPRRWRTMRCGPSTSRRHA